MKVRIETIEYEVYEDMIEVYREDTTVSVNEYLTNELNKKDK